VVAVSLTHGLRKFTHGRKHLGEMKN